MDHAVFRRSDIDLIIDKKISLREALCGFQFPLDHLDGRKLWVRSEEGDVLSPGVWMGWSLGRGGNLSQGDAYLPTLHPSLHPSVVC